MLPARTVLSLRLGETDAAAMTVQMTCADLVLGEAISLMVSLSLEC